MSAPPDSAIGRPPFQDRSRQQNNTLGIRIVPYTPPRLSSESRIASAASSGSRQSNSSQSAAAPAGEDAEERALAGSRSSSHLPTPAAVSRTATEEGRRYRNSSGQASGSSGGSTSISKGDFGDSARDYDLPAGIAELPGSALPTASASFPQLAESRDDSVSGTQTKDGLPLQSPGSPVSPTLRWPAPALHAPPPNLSSIHASSSAWSRESRSPSPSRPTSSSSAASGTTPRPPSRRRQLLTVHSDGKTFSLVPLSANSQFSGSLSSQSQSDSQGSLRSPHLSSSYTATSRASTASHERLSSELFSEDRPSSALTSAVTLPDRSQATLTPASCSPASSTTQLAEYPIDNAPFPSHTTASPWNYRLVGGLRKVPKTPDLKQKQALRAASSSSTIAASAEAPLPPLPELPGAAELADVTPSRTIGPQRSFSSEASVPTASTTSETTNYKVHGQSSPVHGSSDSLVERPSSQNTNYQILGESSPAAPPISSSLPASPFSDENYIVHGGPSPSSSSLVTVSRGPREAYSQESLVVSPLRPYKKTPEQNFGYYKSRSRESLRGRAGSFKSIKSIKSFKSIKSIPSFSSLIGTEAAQAIIANPVLFHLQGTSAAAGSSGSGSASAPGSGHAAAQRQLPAATSSHSPASSPSAPLAAPRIPMQAHPHQWSSQLSTVMSESDGGSSRQLSRSASPTSQGGLSVSGGRRSSTGWAGSMHSRALQSISSSIAAQLEGNETSSHSRSHSRTDSLDRPAPVMTRAGLSNTRVIHDQDEHGDGLGDLQRIRHRPSMRELAALFASHNNSSERNLHSSNSSRAGSLSSGSVPAWARIYYGSGERRFFGTLSDFAPSDSGDSRPSSAWRSNSNSPRPDQYPQTLQNPRKRPQDPRFPGGRFTSRQAKRDSDDISPLPPMEDFNVRRGLRRMTSSIWSPHLRMDKRATRYSMWEPPSYTWSAESGVTGRRNIQVVLFAVGFLIPFAWMIAAVLPLPPKPTLPMMERSQSESHVGGQADSFGLLYPVDDSRYQSARWWRNLNRFMAVIGLLVLGAVAALVVIGLREGWAR